MEPHERIIVALDVDNLHDACMLVQDLRPYVGYFKVGLELLTSEGSRRVVDTLHGGNARIFYDGKFLDIPNTVAGASRAVARLGVDMFNVHASGGSAMVRAAVESKGESKVLAVTVLTSLDAPRINAIFGAAPEEKVLQFAQLAATAKVDGLICSPEELGLLRSKFKSLLLVTPGVRPTWAAKGDQARVATPGEAIRAGADYLVIGRPITKPPSSVGTCVDAARLIIEEIEGALKEG